MNIENPSNTTPSYPITSNTNPSYPITSSDYPITSSDYPITSDTNTSDTNIMLPNSTNIKSSNVKFIICATIAALLTLTTLIYGISINNFSVGLNTEFIVLMSLLASAVFFAITSFII